MAITLAECDAMIEAARAAGVTLVIGHSHSFDAPVLRARELIASRRFGDVRMITAMNYTDFLYRPRRPEELDTRQGGGVVFSQGAHQVDVVRLLAGGQATSVRAHTGAWDRARPTEGAYAAQIAFANGAFASLTYNGYGHFDSDEFVDWIGELGHPKDRVALRRGARRAARRGGCGRRRPRSRTRAHTAGRTPRRRRRSRTTTSACWSPRATAPTCAPPRRA